MNGSSHRLITEKAIEFLTKVCPEDAIINRHLLSDYAEEIAKTNSDTDRLKDLEFVDVEGCKNTGRDNPHKSESDAIDDEAHYKVTDLGLDLELTSFSHFIDIKKGQGRFDDYDGYSYNYGSANKEQYEIIKSGWIDGIENYGGWKYVDAVTSWWLNDEYVHAPGQEYYQNCSPAVWRYSFPSERNLFKDKFDELKARFPLAEYKGKKNKGMPYSVMMPVDNLGRYWYETFLLSGNLPDLGPLLHAVQDASVPHHASGYLGNYHRDYEDSLQTLAEEYTATSEYYQAVMEYFDIWSKENDDVPVTLVYENDFDRIPNRKWRIDFLITWVAFHAYDAYANIYHNFKNGNAFSEESAKKLLVLATAISMLVLVKAKKECEELVLSDELRVEYITIEDYTDIWENAESKSRLKLYLFEDYCGGAVELDFPEVKRKQWEKNTSNFEVGSFFINASKFHIGIGIMGQDAWLPSSFNISYVTADGKRHIYANHYNWNMDVWFDSVFWHEIPKRPFHFKSEIVEKAIVSFETSTKYHADTKGWLAIYILSDKDVATMIEINNEDCIKGQQDTYILDISDYDIPQKVLKTGIANRSSDAWHPKWVSIKLLNYEGITTYSKKVQWQNNKWLENEVNRTNLIWLEDMPDD